MPGINYKELFERVNESRKTRGVKPLSWSEFLGKEPKQIHREKLKMMDTVDPDTTKEIQRPPTNYDNISRESIFKKYGL